MEEKQNFEEKLKRLDEIVEMMSNKSLPLDQSIALYEEGNKIIKDLEAALKMAEEKIEEIIEVK